MIKKQKIIVVGGSSGIGFAVARKASEAGAEVIIASRTTEKLEAVVEQLGGHVRAQVLDATDERSISEFYNHVGSFDHLVISIRPSLPSGPFLENEMASAGAAFDAKFWGQYRLAKHGAAHIRPNGSITFTSGIASLRAYPGYSVASAINAAVEALCKAIAVELAPIRINCVCPGFVDVFPSNSNRNYHVRRLAPNLPLDRLGVANEIADAYLYLFSSHYSTGTVLVVDGGASC